jgi:hypothetical protein
MNWRVQGYQEHELYSISQFFKRVYVGRGFYGSMGLFHWKIAKNCHGKGIINLIKDGETIASTTTITPKKLIFNGSETLAAEIGDTYTGPNYQRQGMFVQLINQTRQDAESRSIEFIYGTPNHQSLPGYQKKANFEQLQRLDVRALNFPLNLKPQLQKKLHWLLAEAANLIYRIPLWLYVQLVRLSSGSAKYAIAEETQMPPGWASFWKQASAPYSFILDRSEESLTWRFFDSPYRYHFCSVKNRNSELCGYFVYRLAEDEGLSRLVLADFLFLPNEMSAFKASLGYLLRKSLTFDTESLSVWCVKDSKYYDILRRLLFLDRSNIPVICYRNKIFQALSDCRSWHFTVSDSDNI